jgi:hypothetical protein
MTTRAIVTWRALHAELQLARAMAGMFNSLYWSFHEQGGWATTNQNTRSGQAEGGSQYSLHVTIGYTVVRQRTGPAAASIAATECTRAHRTAAPHHDS